jgi:hypothetical protein
VDVVRGDANFKGTWKKKIRADGAFGFSFFFGSMDRLWNTKLEHAG